MKTFLFWIILVPLALVALVFLISNRTLIPVDLWPLPVVFRPPLSVVILASVFAGFLLGGFITWTSASKARRQARLDARRVRSLERELEISRVQEEMMNTSAGGETLPALTSPSSRNAA
ncbi:MAG: LapA family protein [Rhodospirillaceae bacterium]|nr:LapA family protein [Rhodospirillales bacterium]MBT3907470.1 LapA family protein [Rhodospirillaceae bacterium]MBT4702502.1 LapA family protein [Rhodospirillaceae bacterium]MBT5033780.1 LapA family protein [Rhodospirillaceae bacterium]MBT6363133.1 LapA family protein [Rhodospirillaceae bacterium]